MRGNCAWGPSYDTEGESIRNVIFWWNLHRDLFSSWKTTKQALRRSVKQSGPTVNQDRSHAWQLFTVLLSSPLLASPPPPACSSGRHLPHPSVVTIIALRGMIFQNSITHPFIPWSELKAWTWQQGQVQEILRGKYNWVSAVVLSNQKPSQSHYFMYIYMVEVIEKFHPFIYN